MALLCSSQKWRCCRVDNSVVASQVPLRVGIQQSHGRRQSFSLRNYRQVQRLPSVVAQAASQPDVEWATATIQLKKQLAEDVFVITVDAPGSLDTYKLVGQFVMMKVGDSKPAYFAVASPPGVKPMEFLIKSVPETTSATICDMPQGGKFDISPTMGKGFQLDKAPPAEFPEVVMFTAGTGISPIKAIIESEALEPTKRRRIRLYYGGYDEGSLAYSEQFNNWKGLGAEIIPVYNKSGAFVQDEFKTSPDLENPAETVAVLCGGPALMDGCTAVLQELGVTTILKNY